MTNQNFPRRLLDDAIDHAVRELVQTDARPGFRRRVLDRLAAPPARRSWLPRVLIPASAFAVIVLAVILMRPERDTPAPTVAANPPVTSPVTSPAAPPTPSSDDVPPRRVPRPEPSVAFSFGARSDRVTATNIREIEEPVLPMMPLEEDVPVLPPLELAPLPALADITLKPIELRPLGEGRSSDSR